MMKMQFYLHANLSCFEKKTMYTMQTKDYIISQIVIVEEGSNRSPSSSPSTISATGGRLALLKILLSTLPVTSTPIPSRLLLQLLELKFTPVNPSCINGSGLMVITAGAKVTRWSAWGSGVWFISDDVVAGE